MISGIYTISIEFLRNLKYIIYISLYRTLIMINVKVSKVKTSLGFQKIYNLIGLTWEMWVNSLHETSATTGALFAIRNQDSLWNLIYIYISQH